MWEKMAFKVWLLKAIARALFKLYSVIALKCVIWHSSAQILKLWLDVFFVSVLCVYCCSMIETFSWKSGLCFYRLHGLCSSKHKNSVFHRNTGRMNIGTTGSISNFQLKMVWFIIGNFNCLCQVMFIRSVVAYFVH